MEIGNTIRFHSHLPVNMLLYIYPPMPLPRGRGQPLRANPVALLVVAQMARLSAGQVFEMIRDLLAAMQPHILPTVRADGPRLILHSRLICRDLFLAVRFQQCSLHSGDLR